MYYRALPDLEFKYSALLTTAAAAPSTVTTYIVQMILTNIGATDQTVTISSNAGTVTQASIVVSAHDQFSKKYDEAWDIVGGLTISCDANNAIQAQIYGRKNYS